MFRIKKYNLKMFNKSSYGLFLFFTLFIFLFVGSLVSNRYIILKSNNYYNKSKNDLKSSAIWGWINFTSYQINESQYYPDDIFRIKGRLFYLPDNTSYSGYLVNLIVDGNPLPSYNNVTDNHGRFEIPYTVPRSGNIYSGHIFEAEVTNPGGQVKLLNHLYIFYRTNFSFFINDPLISKIPGEYFEFNGDLRYYNGSIISDKAINYYWYLGAALIQSGFTYVDYSGYIQSVQIPFVGSDNLSIRLSYSSPQVDYSETWIYNTKIFTDISCIWNLPSTITENSDLNIAGQLVSSTDPSVVISYRDIEIYYNGSFIGTDIIDSNGDFSYTYPLPAGIGLSSLRIVLIGSGLETTQYIDVEAEQPGEPSTPGEAPFLMFLAIFLPILAVVIVGLSFYGYRYYKKQDKLSRVVNLPLESKIINLKILKDSGRLEESLSYLFNAIYMDLVNAKFGRTRDVKETIRDFAIISVKDLKLNPTTIYPFIQKIEEIIYAKPFQISDNDFYKTVELFSPIYLQLTGYNFVLNF